jgi:hypothetical protein
MDEQSRRWGIKLMIKKQRRPIAFCSGKDAENAEK